MDPIYQLPITITAEAIDENGHVNNVEYIRWFQAAAVHHANAVGCAQKTEAYGATWVVRSHHIEYLKPAFLGDALTVLTWVSTLRRARSLRKYKIVRKSDNSLIAHGSTDWVFVDLGSGRPREIPTDVVSCFVVVSLDEEATAIPSLAAH